MSEQYTYIWVCVYTFCFAYVAASSQYSLKSHRHTECNNQAWKKQSQLFLFATGGYNPQCRMCVLLTWCLRTYQNGFPCENANRNICFYHFCAGSNNADWKTSLERKSHGLLLHTNYVYFIFALSYLFSSINIPLVYTGQSKISLLNFYRGPTTMELTLELLC